MQENINVLEKEQIYHIISQLDTIRERYEGKCSISIIPYEVIEAVVDSMDAVTQTLENYLDIYFWNSFYKQVHNCQYGEDFWDIFLKWKKDVIEAMERIEQISSPSLNNDRMMSMRIDELVGIINELTKKVSEQAMLINQLYSNYGIRKGWRLEINKEKINYSIELESNRLGITEKKREQQLIVSLTSFPERMYDIKYTVYSLLHQTIKPDRVILWLAKEQFPNMEEDIAPSLLALKKNGLSIMWCEDIKSYKKLIPAIKMFPNEIIVTADDDVFYPEDWLEKLYNSYMQFPQYVHCHRAHKIGLQNNKLLPYDKWKHEIVDEHPMYSNFMTGVGGVLYPPHSLYENVLNESIFMNLAPRADDIWFWAMCVLNRTKITVIRDGYKTPQPINWAREIGLYDETTLASDNTGVNSGNDIQLVNVMREYPELMKILLEEN